MELTRSIVKAHILDGDQVYVSVGKRDVPEKADHRVSWPKLVAVIGTKGAWHSTLKANLRRQQGLRGLSNRRSGGTELSRSRKAA
jgi:hypothetical protein